MVAAVLGLSGAETAAWVAAIGGIVALGTQLYTAVRKRKQEKTEIDQALDRQPMVRQQLELGNVGEAVKHLNAIIASQAAHIKQQDQRLDQDEAEIARLRNRNDALEAEAESWERKHNELEREMREMRRTYARSLAMMKQEKQRRDDRE